MLIAIDAEPANREMRTGVETAVFNLLKSLMELEAGSAARRYILFTKKALRSDWPVLPSNFQHRRLPWPSEYFWAHFRLGMALRVLKPDLTFILGNIIPFFAPGPVITVIHDIVFVDYPGLHTGRTLFAHTFALKRALQKASLIITPSQATKEAIAGHFPTFEKPITVIPWGIDHQIFRPQASDKDEQILQKFNLADKQYFLYVGRLEAKKNSQNLISAFREFKKSRPDVELVLVGDNQDQIDLSGARSLGHQSNAVTAVLYRHALAFVFPTLYEGFGLPVLEAQASGCPVICSNLAVLKEVAGAAALFVEPKDTKELIEALVKLATDGNLRQNLASRGLANAQKYTWSGTARALLETIVKVKPEMV